MNYSVVIAEDEKLSADLLEIILSEIGSDSIRLSVKQIAHSGDEAIAAVLKHKPDILFLDINMPQGDGFTVLEAIDDDCDMPAIIFTTAHSRFAVRAFDVEAADYLLKPLSNDRVLRAVQKVMKVKAAVSGNAPVSAAQPSTLKVPTKDGAEFISTANIDAMEASGDYIYIYTDNRKLMIRGTLRDYSQKFAPIFYQTHRSYLINVNSVKAIHRKANGGAIILLNNGKEVPLSRRYKSGLFQILPYMI